jgi:tRNA G10  N-methylase Trm11
MIDPFAGGGGIIYLHKYIEPGGIMTSVDNDPVLKSGLEYYGASHHVMDAKEIYYPKNSFDSVITEVPFSTHIIETINKVFKNLDNCLSKNGVYVIMCKKDQGKDIEKIMIELGSFNLFNQKIDRKGIDVEIQIWHKDKELIDKMRNFLSVLEKIY